MDSQADLSLGEGHRLFCCVFNALAHIKSYFTRTKEGGGGGERGGGREGGGDRTRC